MDHSHGAHRGPNPLDPRHDFSGPALRHGSLNSLLQVALHLPSSAGVLRRLPFLPALPLLPRRRPRRPGGIRCPLLKVSVNYSEVDVHMGRK